jgi:hypothetical protein
MLKALKRTPGRHERGLYLAVIAVLALCLLAVMGVNRRLMTARAHERAAYAQLRVAMEQARAAAAIAKDARRAAEIRAEAAEARAALAAWSVTPTSTGGWTALVLERVKDTGMVTVVDCGDDGNGQSCEGGWDLYELRFKEGGQPVRFPERAPIDQIARSPRLLKAIRRLYPPVSTETHKDDSGYYRLRVLSAERSGRPGPDQIPL